ncbi:MAG: CPBP family intramembrane metalloprotease [Chloroflexi bacterium]|nr:CPBP family intramembrane metalloprotease [Chloroflexota bacterium]
MPSDLVIVIVLEIRLNEATGTMSMCIPYSVLEPISSRLSTHALFGGRRSSPARMLGWAALAFLASYAATLVYVLAAESVTDAAVPPPIPASFLEELPLLTLVLVVLVGPAAEEVFFRGFCFAGLVGRWGFWGAAAASSALFGLAHLDPALMGPAFVSGFVFAWAYWRTGSLWPVVLAHTARNGVALAVVASL